MRRFNIDNDYIRELAGLLESTGLTEIELAQGDIRIRLSRAAGQADAAIAANVGTHINGHAVPDDDDENAELAAILNHPGLVVSPMVGTAYLQTEPGAPPFVKEGARVAVGDSLAVIEAMKVMNPIKASRSGIVKRVLMTDSQPVEYGEPLFIIE
ncbi:MAG: acetyl-CoA carboxylase biotin carboxyl carrier protein subunit [Pseudomonadota bacterium]|nr:acetyl-CoA carboxylase biotin carboxyl carrier protein subunit [Pseudomonadota bacterium]